MVSTTTSSPPPAGIPAADLLSFRAHLSSSTRILALLGAGLSASSGLPTFRGAGGLWRSHDATTLATMEAFEIDPGLVWQFYAHRRHAALRAQPNPAHYALAELAKRKPGFQTLSQNVDGLSQRAGHPACQLHLLHGNLFDLKCSSFFCSHREADNFADPLVPALAVADDEGEEPNLDTLPPSALPHCPTCRTGLLRPGVVWFGEMLPQTTLRTIDDFIDEGERIDLIMVIGTSSTVWPAAGYVDRARAKGARVAVVNVERTDALREGDWFFQGDAGVVVPALLEGVVGGEGEGGDV